MERTLILVKPDAFARGLTGEIIARFERKGLSIVALKHMQVTEDLAKEHYAEHDGKPFFGELVEFITSAPLVAMVLEGDEAITAARQVIGATNPLEADHRLDPRRLRHPGRPEHGPRLRRSRVGRPRVGPLLPGARGLSLILASASPQRRAILEPARGRVRGRARPTSRSWPRGRRSRSPSRTPTARPRPSRAEHADRRVLGCDTLVALGRGCTASRPTRRRPARRCRRWPGASTSSSPGCA